MTFQSIAKLCILSLLLHLSACTSSDDDDDAPPPSTDAGTTQGSTGDNTVLSSCQAIEAVELTATGGVTNTVLPADLSVADTQINLLSIQSGEFTSFDPTSGAVSFVPGLSRLSSVVDYQVLDAQGVVLATHQHRWVFTPVRVMPLGDSITAGVEFFDGMVDTPIKSMRVGYRKFLYDRLLSEGYAIDYLGQGGQSAGAEAGLADPENNGYPGVDIDFLNNKLLEQLAEDKVDIILLHIGTNNTPADAAGIEVWLDTLDAWESENFPVLAMVASIVPKRNSVNNAQVVLFNQDLRARIAARTNDNVILVEQNLSVSVDDISLEDAGLHPTAAGYQKMADTWFDALTVAAAAQFAKCEL